MGRTHDGWRLKPVKIFSSDLDGTLVGRPDALAAFATFWAGLDPSTRPLLVYNSGRQIEDIVALIPEVGLPQPDVMIGGVGSELTNAANGDHGHHYARSLGPVLERDRISAVLADFPRIKPQLDIYQHDYKSSWQLHDATTDEIEDLERRFATAGLDVGLIYSSGRDLDILPSGTDKGSALRWLAAEMGVELSEVVVAGDTGNDVRMFELPEIRGVIVGNALPELRALGESRPRLYQAHATVAEGVLEGLRHFGLGM